MKVVEEILLGNKRVTFEAGQIARQAHGAVVVRHETSMVLATVVADPSIVWNGERANDFVPLTVEYRERMSASGRIPGGYGKREARIGDHEVLTSRLIDRALRPLFPKGFATEVQVLVTCYGADPKSDLESLALLAAAAAMHVSQLPVEVVAGLRIAQSGERTVLMPTEAERDAADLEWVVAATRAGHGQPIGPSAGGHGQPFGPSAGGLVMVEGGAGGASEEVVLASLAQATAALQPVFEVFDRLRTAVGREKSAFVAPVGPSAELLAAIDRHYGERMVIAYRAAKVERRAGVASIARAAGDELGPAYPGANVAAAVEARWRRLVRERSAAGERIGEGFGEGGGEGGVGRGLEDVRPILSEVAYLPSNHGSALFTRGETQALVSVTLGGTDDHAQIIDGLMPEPRRGAASCCTTTSRRSRSAR